MSTTTNLDNLVINYLTQEQYDAAAQAGTLNQNQIYLTPASTNVSDFTNDAGYLTSYTETDPTVPAWAKASTKPSYTASEVGAMATTHAANAITATDISNWNAKSNFSGSYNDLTNKPTIPAAQVQSDWNATTGMGVILNKPTIPAEPLVITAELDHSDYTNNIDYYTADVTFSEAKQALYGNRRLILKFSTYDNRQCINLHIDDVNGNSIVGTIGEPIESHYWWGVTWDENDDIIVRPMTCIEDVVNDAIGAVYNDINNAGYLTLADLPIYDGTVQNG